ncbi:mas-related G-protein coupled receptor member D-like [Moschus berezovskii]|uniref:mas-related G-protein coupled receptor member D-like n=1 Tax=Moschus berezovskii TaxID=68408 RepID=UPI0024444467|nr:mas-related G-protein coupled receptor member D-like [Moschus berezovskii]
MENTLNSSGSRSSSPGPTPAPPDTVREVLDALVMFTCVGGIVGNGLVVWLLSSRWRRGPLGIYLLHLAVADLLFVLCLAALTVLSASSWGARLHPLGPRAVRSAGYLAYTVSLSLLTAASAQSCLPGLFPTWNRGRRHRRLSATVCCALWLLAVLLIVPAWYFHDEAGRPHPWPGSKAETVLHFFTLVSFTPVMALSGMALCIQVQRSSRPWQRPLPRLYMAVLLCVFMFLACALPLGISGFLLYWLDLPQRAKTLFGHLTCLSLSVSSSSKPMIYFLVGSGGHLSLREPLGAVLSRVLQEEPKLEEGETPSTNPSDEGRLPKRKA